MKTKLFALLNIVGIIGILYLVTFPISEIKTNKNNIFGEYFDMKDIIDIYAEYLPKCVELNVILTKNLEDNVIKQYEKWELDYYLNKNKECSESINYFVDNFFKKDVEYKYNDSKEKVLKENAQKRKLLNSEANNGK